MPVLIPPLQDLGPLDPAKAATVGGDVAGTETHGRSELLRSMLASTVAAVRLHGGDVSPGLETKTAPTSFCASRRA